MAWNTFLACKLIVHVLSLVVSDCNITDKKSNGNVKGWYGEGANEGEGSTRGGGIVGEALQQACKCIYQNRKKIVKIVKKL